VYSFGAFGQEHTEDHAAGLLMGGPSDSRQTPPLWGTLPAQGSAAQREDSHVQSADAMNFATRGPYKPGCGARSVAQRSSRLTNAARHL
jgi:hypothetical protein